MCIHNIEECVTKWGTGTDPNLFLARLFCNYWPGGLGSGTHFCDKRERPFEEETKTAFKICPDVRIKHDTWSRRSSNRNTCDNCRYFVLKHGWPGKTFREATIILLDLDGVVAQPTREASSPALQSPRHGTRIERKSSAMTRTEHTAGTPNLRPRPVIHYHEPTISDSESDSQFEISKAQGKGSHARTANENLMEYEGPRRKRRNVTTIIESDVKVLSAADETKSGTDLGHAIHEWSAHRDTAANRPTYYRYQTPPSYEQSPPSYGQLQQRVADYVRQGSQLVQELSEVSPPQASHEECEKKFDDLMEKYMKVATVLGETGFGHWGLLDVGAKRLKGHLEELQKRNAASELKIQELTADVEIATDKITGLEADKKRAHEKLAILKGVFADE